MDVKPKTNVIKSKSSNSALVSRPDRKTKKIRPKPEFQPLVVKKRGVYVENKTTKSLDTHGTDSSQTEKKSPPPPRPGKKRFLTSVLSILAKNTTGTQHPAGFRITDAKKDRKKKIIDEKRTKTIDTTEDTFETEGTTVTEKMSSTELEEFRSQVQDKKKRKYRSKILNDYINADKFEVLQSKKDQNLSNSPSIGSDIEREEINWVGFPKLVNDYGSEHGPMNDLVKQISEGRKPKEKVKVLEKDPSTLVAQHKDDKKLYNFFVDILETTFSVYNVKTEFNNTASAASSKVALEIDESVAKKLRFKNEENQEITDDVTQKPSKPYYTIKDSKVDRSGVKMSENVETKSAKRREHQTRSTSPQKRREARSRSPQGRYVARSKSPQKKHLKSESFSYPRDRITPPMSRSAEISQRSSLYKKNKKRDLLNMLREQLKMDDYYYNEPQNLYDALKIMVRNKRKCQKTLRFMSNKKTADLQDDCMLKRRKIITPSSSFKHPKPGLPMRQSEISRIRQKSIKNDESTDCEPSNHSIEVYGFDYDIPTKKRMITPKLKQYFLTYHSSDSDFEENQTGIEYHKN